MKRNKKLTRKQKREMNPNGSGNSKYAAKIGRRAKLAHKHGLAAATSFPAIWAIIPASERIASR